MEESDLRTLPQWARHYGFTTRQCDYAVQTYSIEPTRRVGIIRLFDGVAAERIKSAVTRISSRREAIIVR